jgi:hypothetical protein
MTQDRVQYGNEHSNSMKGEGFLDRLINCKIFKEDLASLFL